MNILLRLEMLTCTPTLGVLMGVAQTCPKMKLWEACKLGAILHMVKEDPNMDAIDPNEAHVGMNSPAIRAKTAKEMVNVPKHGRGPVHWGRSNESDRIMHNKFQTKDKSSRILLE